MAYAKINNVADAIMAKVFNIAKAGFGKVAGVDAPQDAFADQYSLEFDGVNDQANVDGAGAVISGDLGSISMWFKQPVTASAITHLYFEADGNNRLLIYHHGGRNELTFEHKGGGTERSIISTTTVEGNGWHHFVYTWNTAADASTLYLDGSAAGTGQAADFTGTISNISIGWRYGSGMYYEGNINDVAFFDDVLTSGEAAAIYQNGDPKDESSHSGLVGYWKMEENTGTSVEDSSSNSNAITLVNGTAFDNDVSWGWNDTKALTGITSTSTYLESTTNMPQIIHHADTSQNWTFVHRFDFDKDETHYTFGMGFSSGKYFSCGYWGQNSQALIWTFMQGHTQGPGPGHMPIYVNTMNASQKYTLVWSKGGATNEDVKIYVNGSAAFDSSTDPTNAAPLYTSAPTSLTIGKMPQGGGFPNGGNKKLNDFAIFDGSFTEAEATEAHNSGTTLDMRAHSRASDLEHYWMMGDGDNGAGTGTSDGTTVYDMAGDCDLTMNGIDATDIVTW